MRWRLFRIKVLALSVGGAVLPAFIVSCEKAFKTVQLGFLEGLGFNSSMLLLQATQAGGGG